MSEAALKAILDGITAAGREMQACTAKLDASERGEYHSEGAATVSIVELMGR